MTARRRLALLLAVAAVLLLAGCEHFGSSSSMYMNASYGYYGGPGWYDPYYYRRPGYGYPMRPPAYRPPVYRPPGGGRPPSGGRPANLPSRAAPPRPARR